MIILKNKEAKGLTKGFETRSVSSAFQYSTAAHRPALVNKSTTAKKRLCLFILFYLVLILVAEGSISGDGIKNSEKAKV